MLKSFVYGDGEILDANEYEVAYFTKRGEDFWKGQQLSHTVSQSLKLRQITGIWKKQKNQ